MAIAQVECWLKVRDNDRNKVSLNASMPPLNLSAAGYQSGLGR